MKSGLFLLLVLITCFSFPGKAPADELKLEPCHLAGSLGTRRLLAECGTLVVPENPDADDGKNY